MNASKCPHLSSILAIQIVFRQVKQRKNYENQDEICMQDYCKIPVISPGLIQLCKGLLVNKRKIFWQGSIILANVVWLHVNNCCKGAVACLYQEGGYNWNNVLSPDWWNYNWGGL